jgi:glycosyltransferase involved in cell wall biosynthesis
MQFQNKVNMKLLFISDCYVSETVFVSQVHTLCNVHSESFDVTLISLCGLKDILIKPPRGARYTLVKRLRFPRLYIPWVSLVFTKISFLSKYYNSADVVHSRGHIGTGVALNLADNSSENKIVADIRGALDYEILETNISKKVTYAKKCRSLELNIFNKINNFLFVSENMKNFYITRYGLAEKSINIVPTIVDDNIFFKDDNKRNKIRKKLKITEKFVFLYAGGVQKWQNLDLILDEFEKSNRNKEIFLIILTQNKESVINLIKSKNIKSNNIYVNYVEYKEVPYYINAADAGLIIRDKKMFNYVASPTKVSEYASCGLKLATSTDQFSSLSGFSNGNYMNLIDIINCHKCIYMDLASK